MFNQAIPTAVLAMYRHSISQNVGYTGALFKSSTDKTNEDAGDGRVHHLELIADVYVCNGWRSIVLRSVNSV